VPWPSPMLTRLLLAGSLLWVTAVQASTRSWTGSTSDSLWGNATNWGGIAPVAGDDLVFEGPAYRTINDFPTGTLFNSITVRNPGFEFKGNAVRIGGGGVYLLGGSVAFALSEVALESSQTWTNPIFAGLTTYIGPTDVGGNTLTLDNRSWFVFDAIRGTGAIIQNGGVGSADTVFRASSFTGRLTVNGIVHLESGTAGNVVVHEGGYFDIKDGSVGTIDVDRTALFKFRGQAHCRGLRILRGGNALRVYIEASSSTTLHVVGTVDLGDAGVAVALPRVAPGTQLVVIDNDETDPIIGTFAGLPEGALIRPEYYDDLLFRISYVGGSGNDVTLRAFATASIPLTNGTGLVAFACALATIGCLMMRRITTV